MTKKYFSYIKISLSSHQKLKFKACKIHIHSISQRWCQRRNFFFFIVHLLCCMLKISFTFHFPFRSSSFEFFFFFSFRFFKNQICCECEGEWNCRWWWWCCCLVNQQNSTFSAMFVLHYRIFTAVCFFLSLTLNIVWCWILFYLFRRGRKGDFEEILCF